MGNYRAMTQSDKGSEKRDGHFTDKAQDAALRADHSEFNYKL